MERWVLVKENSLWTTNVYVDYHIGGSWSQTATCFVVLMTCIFLKCKPEDSQKVNSLKHWTLQHVLYTWKQICAKVKQENLELLFGLFHFFFSPLPSSTISSSSFSRVSLCIVCGKSLLLFRTKCLTNESLGVNKRWNTACISEVQGVGWFCGQDHLTP